MSSKGGGGVGGGVRSCQRTCFITITTPHVLRFRRPVPHQPADEDEPDASCTSSEYSRSPSPPLPCLPATGRSRIVSLRCLPTAPYIPHPLAASPSSSAATPSTATSPPADWGGGDTAGVRRKSTGARTPWSTLSWPPARRTEATSGADDTDTEPTHLSMGCDLMGVVPTDLEPQQEAASLPQDGAAESMIDRAEPAPQMPALRSVGTLTEEAVTSGPATPLVGSQILSAADIPLQDEYVIDNLADESNQFIKYEPDGGVSQPIGYVSDDETMVEEVFGCVGRGDGSSDEDGLWSDPAALVADNCSEDCRTETTPGRTEVTTSSPQMVNPHQISRSGASRGGSQATTPGCRCSLATSYNKKMLLDQHLDVQILPADPLSPPEDRGVPESKASVAIQQLISSVVPPISVELVEPRLCLDSESLDAWPSRNGATAAYTGQPQASVSDPSPPRAAEGNETLFLPSVGPAAETLDFQLLPEGPTTILTPDDVVEIDEPAACARLGKGGRGRGQKARGGARRSAKTNIGEGKRSSRGRGRRGRGRGRGRARKSSAVREAAGELFVSADNQQEEAWLAQTARGRRGGDGGGSDGEPLALCRRPCQHFRRVVVGLSDLGPQPLAPTSKYKLWRRLSGTPEMLDLCCCLDLSYLVLELPNGDVRYRCNICGKEFSLQSSVRRHHRMVHDDERRYTCAECAASYYQLSDLKRHLLASHTDLKPFTCHRCGEQFARDTDYRKHLGLHHKC